MANNLNIDLTGKAVVVREAARAVRDRPLARRIFQVASKGAGFGASPDLSGDTLYGHYVVGRGHTHIVSRFVERLAAPAEVEAARSFERAEGTWVEGTIHCLLITVPHVGPDMPDGAIDNDASNLVGELLRAGQAAGYVLDWRFPTGSVEHTEAGALRGTHERPVYGVRFGVREHDGFPTYTVVPVEVYTVTADETRLDDLWHVSPELRVAWVTRSSGDFVAGQYKEGDAWR